MLHGHHVKAVNVGGRDVPEELFAQLGSMCRHGVVLGYLTARCERQGSYL